METSIKIYPNGTTEEQWEKYYEEVARHNEFISRYRFFLDRIVKHLEWRSPSNTWTTDQITKVIKDEIDRADSMDAPNKPGYSRANND